MNKYEELDRLAYLFGDNSYKDRFSYDEEYKSFVDIPGYEGLYAANKLGEIWSYQTNSIMKLAESHHGYKRIGLRNANHVLKIYAVHRIIASMFVPNPHGYREVNHKNEDTSDNRAANLEWCSRLYNCNYGHKNEKVSKRVASYNESAHMDALYPSQKIASIMTGASQGAISNACLGRAKTAGGKHWKLIEQNDTPITSSFLEDNTNNGSL